MIAQRYHLRAVSTIFVVFLRAVFLAALGLHCTAHPARSGGEIQAGTRVARDASDPRARTPKTKDPRKARTLSEILAHHARSLGGAEDLDALLKHMGTSSTVLLGEASHGTREFYLWRDRISRRLIQEKGFLLVAVEGDWASMFEINRFIRGEDHQHLSAGALLKAVMQRWPQWMWANREFAAFVTWLRAHNAALPSGQRVGIYGMDIYDLKGSVDAVLAFLKRADPARHQDASRLYATLQALDGDTRRYMRHVATTRSDERKNAGAMLAWLERHRVDYVRATSAEDFFNAAQNARVVIRAEAHYRANVLRDGVPWNIRATHFADTVDRLLVFHQGKKILAWAHNTHVGDARATGMRAAGRTNMGEVLRRRHGAPVYTLGFGTYQGSVMAGRRRGATAEMMTVPAAMPGSWEARMNEALSGRNAYFLLNTLSAHPLFTAPVGHRAMGSVYHPERDRPRNYVPTRLSQRYDAFVFIARTKAVTPL